VRNRRSRVSVLAAGQSTRLPVQSWSAQDFELRHLYGVSALSLSVSFSGGCLPGKQRYWGQVSSVLHPSLDRGCYPSADALFFCLWTFYFSDSADEGDGDPNPVHTCPSEFFLRRAGYESRHIKYANKHGYMCFFARSPEFFEDRVWAGWGCVASKLFSSVVSPEFLLGGFQLATDTIERVLFA